ncbi:MAG: hypothetical protein K2Q28_13380 [Hyphomicrobium sp.]|nr:hypothetical protein [Hyphomicrobium sp.]
MDDSFTAVLNRLIEDVEPNAVPKLKFSLRLQQSLSEHKAHKFPSPIIVAVPGNHYLDWSETRHCNVVIACFAEAKKLIVACRGNARTLAKLRRVIAVKLHPDVVPETVAGEADELMKTMNAYLAEARQAS